MTLETQMFVLIYFAPYQNSLFVICMSHLLFSLNTNTSYWFFTDRTVSGGLNTQSIHDVSHPRKKLHGGSKGN